MDSCRSCGAALETPLGCLACGVLHSDEPPSSPFAVLGLRESHDVDARELKKRLLRYSRLVHPDYFAAASRDERERAERFSAALNDAFEIVGDEARRADWLVNAWGGPSERDERAMPQAFLLEVLEWNEALEAARTSESGSSERRALEPLASELAARRASELERVAALLSREHAGDRGGRPSDRSVLVRARQHLNSVQYLDRALAQMRELFLSAASRR